MATPWSAKNPAASTRNRAQVRPVSSGNSWLKATRERSFDGRVDIVVADAASPAGGSTAMHAVAAAVGDAAQLLAVEGGQLAGVLTLIAHHHPAGPVGVGQPAHAVASQDPIDRR